MLVEVTHPFVCFSEVTHPFVCFRLCLTVCESVLSINCWSFVLLSVTVFAITCYSGTYTNWPSPFGVTTGKNTSNPQEQALALPLLQTGGETLWRRIKDTTGTYGKKANGIQVC